MSSRFSRTFVVLIGVAAAAWTAGTTITVAWGDSQAPAAAEKTSGDWSMWGGGPSRNNTPVGKDIATEWNVGEVDYKTGEWKPADAENIKWVAELGSRSYGSCVSHGGKVFVGSNNSAAHLPRYPAEIDLGCLLCFDAETGKFLWQHSSLKLPTGRVHDWPHEGICSVPYCEGDRLWFVTSRGEVRCLDTEGFYDGENDGEVQNEEAEIKATGKPYDLRQEADVVWVLDMMKELGVSQHNMASSSPLAVGDKLFVCTSNGVDEEHKGVPAPDAPSFICLDKNTGKVLWTDNSPGANIHHGQWSSPAYGVIAGQPTVLFGGGDGWLYAFDPEGAGDGKSKLLWKFDTNPKLAKLELMGKGTRNDIIATPVVYEELVYVATGQDPDHGEGIGNLWCINPAKHPGVVDISPELAFNAADPKTPIPYKRVQAVVEKEGDFARPNPNSAVEWHYSEHDLNGDGEIEFEETMHRGIGTATIRDDILYIADFSGVFHCLDAKTGKPHWTYDMMSASWSTPLLVEDKVYIGDEDGEVAIFRHSADPDEAMREEDGEMVPYYGTQSMNGSVYSTPIVANNVLFISNMSHLYAITPEAKSAGE